VPEISRFFGIVRIRAVEPLEGFRLRLHLTNDAVIEPRRPSTHERANLRGTDLELNGRLPRNEKSVEVISRYQREERATVPVTAW